MMGRVCSLLLAGMMVLPLGCVPRGAPTQAPVSGFFLNPPTCGGGPGVAPGVMNANEAALANLINNARQVLNLPQAPPNPICVGLAQWHARDMAEHHYLGFVGSDGEDALTRFVCSGGPPKGSTGLIAVAVTSDPQEAFNALQTDFSARGNLYGASLNTTLSVGYSNGYWLIVQQ